MPLTSVHKANVGTSHRKLKKLVHIQHGPYSSILQEFGQKNKELKTGYQHVLAEAATENRMQ
jgi:hypothetical protein